MDIFNFEKIQCVLLPATKTLKITLLLHHHDLRFSLSLLAELEQVLTWSAAHTEIASILITSDCNTFGKGLTEQECQEFSTQELGNVLKRWQRLIYSCYFIPQIVIMDLRQSAEGMALEFSLAADLRIADEHVQLSFNHLKQGLAPSCGGIGLLGQLVAHSYTRKWFFHHQKIAAPELLASGLLHETYSSAIADKEKTTVQISLLLQSINEQSSVSRMQTKRALLESILPSLDKNLEAETQFALAAYSTNDWKEFLKAKSEFRLPQFTSAKWLATALKKVQALQNSANH